MTLPDIGHFQLLNDMNDTYFSSVCASGPGSLTIPAKLFLYNFLIFWLQYSLTYHNGRLKYEEQLIFSDFMQKYIARDNNSTSGDHLKIEFSIADV